MRRCGACGKSKPESEFNRLNTARKFQPRCRACQKEAKAKTAPAPIELRAIAAYFSVLETLADDDKPSQKFRVYYCTTCVHDRDLRCDGAIDAVWLAVAEAHKRFFECDLCHAPIPPKAAAA